MKYSYLKFLLPSFCEQLANNKNWNDKSTQKEENYQKEAERN